MKPWVRFAQDPPRWNPKNVMLKAAVFFFIIGQVLVFFFFSWLSPQCFDAYSHSLILVVAQILFFVSDSITIFPDKIPYVHLFRMVQSRISSKLLIESKHFFHHFFMLKSRNFCGCFPMFSIRSTLSGFWCFFFLMESWTKPHSKPYLGEVFLKIHKIKMVWWSSHVWPEVAMKKPFKPFKPFKVN